MNSSKNESEIVEDFEVEARSRCYTWPLQQFSYGTLPYGNGTDTPNSNKLSSHLPSLINSISRSSLCSSIASIQTSESFKPLPSISSVLRNSQPSFHQNLHFTPATTSLESLNHEKSTPNQSQQPTPVKKKRIRRRNPDAISQKKPNPWGEESYSDLIAKALECAQDGRMKLNEIYQWFSDNIPYFKERSSQEEAAGWKNSIRHNLSLHSRFMRIQNEGAGKSSWWVINPDAKPGRNPRRRAATMDTTTKVSIDKIRKRNYKKGCMVSRPILSGQSSMLGSQTSVNDPYQDDDGFPSPFAEFRARTQSNLSVTGPSTSRMSPTLDEFDQFDKFDFPPWMEQSSSQPVSELLATETDRMRLESDSYGQTIKQEYIINTALKNQPQQMPQQIIMKMEPMDPKQETGVQPPPSYEELRSVSGQTQMQNPIIRSQLQQQHLTQVKPVMNGAPGNVQYYSNGMFQSTPNQAPQMMGPQGWQQRPTSIHQTHTVTFITGPGGPMNGGQQFSNNTSLPMDLENVMPEHSIMDLDMEAVLRHEASLTRDNQLHFDL